jgi:hypothetical protein|tara:strand:+ start:490 stop:660 length:171 start_codon:yes stop_codon:yes gene_type:complete
MDNSQNYNTGDVVINRENQRQGTILESNEHQVKIQYNEDGLTEWVSRDSVVKLLLS